MTSAILARAGTTLVVLLLLALSSHSTHAQHASTSVVLDLPGSWRASPSMLLAPGAVQSPEAPVGLTTLAALENAGRPWWDRPVQVGAVIGAAAGLSMYLREVDYDNACGDVYIPCEVTLAIRVIGGAGVGALAGKAIVLLRGRGTNPAPL